MERQGSLPGVLDGHERGRADGRPDRLSLDAPVPDEAAMPGRAHPHAEAGHLAVPDRVFRRVRLQLADARVGQPDPPPLHVLPPRQDGRQGLDRFLDRGVGQMGVFQGGRLRSRDRAGGRRCARSPRRAAPRWRMNAWCRAGGHPAARLPPSRRARSNPANATGRADRRPGRPTRTTGADGRGRRAPPRTARPCAGRSCCRADRAAPPGRSAIGGSGSPTCGTRSGAAGAQPATCRGRSGLVAAQHCGEAAVLLGGQEALGAPLPVAADAGAGVAVLRAVSPESRPAA